jgi:hypothetical protein
VAAPIYALRIRGIHPILGVCVLGYARDDRFALLAVNDGQLHLNEYLRQVGSIAPSRMKKRSSRLATVHDLEIKHSCDCKTGICRSRFDALRSRRDPIVVGKEHPRLIQDRCPDSLINISTSLKEGPHVLLEEAGAELLVQGSQDFGGHDHQIRLVGLRA